MEVVRDIPGNLLGVWKVSRRCLDGIRRMSEIWKVSGGCLEGVRSVSGKCMGVLGQISKKYLEPKVFLEHSFPWTK